MCALQKENTRLLRQNTLLGWQEDWVCDNRSELRVHAQEHHVQSLTVGLTHLETTHNVV